jgi:hypothetical protein
MVFLGAGEPSQGQGNPWVWRWIARENTCWARELPADPAVAASRETHWVQQESRAGRDRKMMFGGYREDSVYKL